MYTDAEKLDPRVKQNYKDFANGKSTHQANGRKRKSDSQKRTSKKDVKTNIARGSLLQL